MSTKVLRGKRSNSKSIDEEDKELNNKKRKFEQKDNNDDSIESELSDSESFYDEGVDNQSDDEDLSEEEEYSEDEI